MDCKKRCFKRNKSNEVILLLYRELDIMGINSPMKAQWCPLTRMGDKLTDTRRGA